MSTYLTAEALGALGQPSSGRGLGQLGQGDVDWSAWLQTGLNVTGQVLPSILTAVGGSPTHQTTGGQPLTPATYVPTGQPIIVQTSPPEQSALSSALPWIIGAIALAALFGMSRGRR